jgi:hypothetical protein
VIGSAFVSRQTLTAVGTGSAQTDPNVYGLLGFFRAAYRF